jgi:hypothetical protein
MRTDDKSGYVKLEVRGTLFYQSAISYIRTNDSSFPDAKLVVKLERSEDDKNRVLDRHLQELNGKPVVANGFLDCRRVGQEPGVIYMYLTSESQVERQKKSEAE